MAAAANNNAVEDFKRALQNNVLSQYTLGAILGLEVTPQEIDNAEEKATLILQYLGLYPSQDDVVFCETPFIDRNGNPVVENGVPQICHNICSVKSEPARNKLGFRWRCGGILAGRNQRDPDKYHPVVRKNPLQQHLLETSKVELRKFLKILFEVFMKRDLNEIAELIGGSKTTAVDYVSLIKEALAICGWHDQGKVGGPGDVVEIDEVLLVKRKFNTGRIPVGDFWVFGGVSRATKRRFAMRVPNRTRITLHAEIVDSIEEGSIICSDGWTAYQGIMPTVRPNNNNLLGIYNNAVPPNLKYRDHLVVTHDREFLRPARQEEPLWRDDILPQCRDKQFIGPLPGPLQLGTLLPFRIHTQTVERQWRELRESVESSQDLPMVDRKIGHWLYRENTLRLHQGTKSQQFMQFVADIRRVYPGPNIRPITANRPGARLYPNALAVPLCQCDDCV